MGPEDDRALIPRFSRGELCSRNEFALREPQMPTLVREEYGARLHSADLAATRSTSHITGVASVWSRAWLSSGTTHSPPALGVGENGGVEPGSVLPYFFVTAR